MMNMAILIFHLLPFIKPAIVRSYFPDEEITSYNQAVKISSKANIFKSK